MILGKYGQVFPSRFVAYSPTPHAIIINQSSRAKTQKTTKPLRKHTENTGKGNKKKKSKKQTQKKRTQNSTNYPSSNGMMDNWIHHPMG